MIEVILYSKEVNCLTVITYLSVLRLGPGISVLDTGKMT